MICPMLCEYKTATRIVHGNKPKRVNQLFGISKRQWKKIRKGKMFIVPKTCNKKDELIIADIVCTKTGQHAFWTIIPFSVIQNIQQFLFEFYRYTFMNRV